MHDLLPDTGAWPVKTLRASGLQGISSATRARHHQHRVMLGAPCRDGGEPLCRDEPLACERSAARRRPNPRGARCGSQMTSLWKSCMNGLNEVGIAREGLPRGRLIGPEERGHIVLLPIQSRALEPCQGVFEIPPDPFNGAQLRAVRGQEQQAHVLREGEPLSRMGPTVVQQQKIQAVREGLREVIEDELEHLGVQTGQLQEEAIPISRPTDGSATCRGSSLLAMPNRSLRPMVPLRTTSARAGIGCLPRLTGKKGDSESIPGRNSPPCPLQLKDFCSRPMLMATS
jgi:hypothetical protein